MATTVQPRMVLQRLPAGSVAARPATSCRRMLARPLFSSQPSREAQLAELEKVATGLRKQLEQGATPRDVSASSSGTATPEAGAAASAAAEDVPRKPLPEVGQQTYYQALKEAGGSLVVVDCFTDWCGPCKVILPTLEQWHAELEGKVTMVKFNCNKSNKDLGVSLGIKVAPTFILYKEMKEVARMTGAKAEQLRSLIEEHM